MPGAGEGLQLLTDPLVQAGRDRHRRLEAQARRERPHQVELAVPGRPGGGVVRRGLPPDERRGALRAGGREDVSVAQRLVDLVLGLLGAHPVTDAHLLVALTLSRLGLLALGSLADLGAGEHQGHRQPALPLVGDDAVGDEQLPVDDGVADLLDEGLRCAGGLGDGARDEPVHPGQQDGPAQEVQGADLVGHGDLVGDHRGSQVDRQGRLVEGAGGGGCTARL